MVLGLTLNPSFLSAQTVSNPPATSTPIQHIVVIFGENISFDHYFATYPNALNPPGEPKFTGTLGSNTVNNLLTPVCTVNGVASPCTNLLTANPNYLNGANNGTTTINGVVLNNGVNPFRLDRSQAGTADMNHGYSPEQESYDNGKMDLFPISTGSAGPLPKYYPPAVLTKGLVMGYYDGNTVTAHWNYAQRYALNDNHFITEFGPSTPGAVNLISGQLDGAVLKTPGLTESYVAPDGNGGLSLISDVDPSDDVCSTSANPVSFNGKNIGDLLNAAGITWGWFEGGFDLTIANPNGSTGCHRSTVSPVTGLTETDYVPHHQPFQYYASTRNPAHTRPTNDAVIGTSNDGGANHQYDMHDWFDALKVGNLPSVSFLKAASYQDAHPGNSNPLDEQAFIVSAVNALQQSPFWNSTAVVILYDDSDGWYDHAASPIVNGSQVTGVDVYSGCLNTPATLAGVNFSSAAQGRCGFGVRSPLTVISSWAKHGYIDHTLLNQVSVIRFVEDNWLSPASALLTAPSIRSRTRLRACLISPVRLRRTQLGTCSTQPRANRNRYHAKLVLYSGGGPTGPPPFVIGDTPSLADNLFWQAPVRRSFEPVRCIIRCRRRHRFHHSLARSN